MENSLKSNLADRPQEMIDTLEDKARTFAESLNRLVDSLESLMGMGKRLFGVFRRQKQNLVDLGHGAATNVAPVMGLGKEAIGKGKEVGSRIVRKGREHPFAILAGAVFVIGGVALIVHFLRDQDSSVVTSGLEDRDSISA